MSILLLIHWSQPKPLITTSLVASHEDVLSGSSRVPECRAKVSQRPGGGGHCHIWAVQVCAAVKVWFSGRLLQDRVYISESLGLEQGIIFPETDQLVEDFIQTREKATLGCWGGGLGEFTLVQGNKIQLNQLWYRLRVSGSQRHIPTQKFLKYPPGVNVIPNIDSSVSF